MYTVVHNRGEPIFAIRRKYNYHRKQNLWHRDRYSSRTRDRVWSILMLVFGALIVAAILFLYFQKK